MEARTHQQSSEPTPNFRLDVQLHELLIKPVSGALQLQPAGETQQFPDPIFPQRPELLGPIDENEDWRAPEKRKWTPGQIYHAMQGWLFPYIRSRATGGDFHPLIA